MTNDAQLLARDMREQQARDDAEKRVRDQKNQWIAEQAQRDARAKTAHVFCGFAYLACPTCSINSPPTGAAEERVAATFEKVRKALGIKPQELADLLMFVTRRVLELEGIEDRRKADIHV
jgi:hypothetical protein